MKYKPQKIKDLLKDRKLKATPTRVEVLSIISGFESAVPHSEIQKSLQDYDRITLYRTLNALMDKGIIHKALSDENETFYALCTNQCTTINHNHKHIHFKCISCQEVTCLQAEHPVNISVPDYIIHTIEIAATGLCQKCIR
ncbi:MAG: transcriptional repressor [Bacteroidia bacterium]